MESGVIGLALSGLPVRFGPALLGVRQGNNRVVGLPTAQGLIMLSVEGDSTARLWLSCLATVEKLLIMVQRSAKHGVVFFLSLSLNM